MEGAAMNLYDAAVFLENPKFPHNVGNALRACACFGASKLRWNGDRVDKETAGKKWGGARLPREERLRVFKDAVDWDLVKGHRKGLQELIDEGFTPVCVEVSQEAEKLPIFEHPEQAVYVFGPEDSSVSKGMRTACHRFVTIPTTTCLNLAAAVNVVLYDRLVKSVTAGRDDLQDLWSVLA